MKLFLQHCRRFSVHCWSELPRLLKSELFRSTMHGLMLVIVIPFIFTAVLCVGMALLGVTYEIIRILISSDKHLIADLTRANVMKSGIDLVIWISIGFLGLLLIIDALRPLKKFLIKAWQETSSKGLAKRLFG